MSQLPETLSPNWISAIIGAAGVIIGVLVTVIVAYLFSSRSRLATQINSLQLLGPNPALPGEIEFLFKGTKVPNVTLSRVAIWNIGNTTLRGDQIVESDALRIVTSEGSTVLEATVRNRTRSVNAFTCSVNALGTSKVALGTSNTVFCQFDYLDPRDGALIEIIHTGSDKVKVAGTLRGVRKRTLVVGVPAKEEIKKQSDVASALLMKSLGVALILIGLGLFLWPLLFPQLGSVKPEGRVLLFFFGFTLALTGILAVWASRRMPPRQLSTQITTLAPKPMTRNIWVFKGRVRRGKS